MEKKKIAAYLALFGMVTICSCLLPLGIQEATEQITHRILPEKNTEKKEKETEPAFQVTGTSDGEENFPVPLKPEEIPEKETEHGSLPETEKSEENLQEQREEQDMSLKKYRKENKSVKITESEKGAADIFVGNRKAGLVACVSDYLYSGYKNSFELTGIEIGECVKDASDEKVFHIKVKVKINQKAFEEEFICMYDAFLDFYSIYEYALR